MPSRGADGARRLRQASADWSAGQLERRPTIRRLVGLVRRLVERLVEIEIVDRALAVGAQAFGALVPLLIVIASLRPRRDRSFADTMIERFDLSGSGADAVRAAFSASSASGVSVSLIGGLLVIVSALSFSRTLQRVFERTWDLPALGMRATSGGLRWLAVVVVYVGLHPLLADAFHGLTGFVAASLAAFVFWLLTPYLLLRGRVAWRRLIPQAALCGIGMTVLTVGSVLYVPRAMNSSAEQFGAIGVAFTLLSVLWAGGFVIVGAAAIGSLGRGASFDHAAVHRVD